MKRFRDVAMLATIAGLAAYQGRQLHIYAAQAPVAPTMATTGREAEVRALMLEVLQV